MYLSVYAWLLDHLNLLAAALMQFLPDQEKGLGEPERSLDMHNIASCKPPIEISQQMRGTKKSWSNKALEKNIGL